MSRSEKESRAGAFNPFSLSRSASSNLLAKLVIVVGSLDRTTVDVGSA